VLRDVAPTHKRHVKWKDELVPYETAHLTGKGNYKRIQLRYSTSARTVRLVFLGYSMREVYDTICGTPHPDFRLHIPKHALDTDLSGEVGLRTPAEQGSLYTYSLTGYIPFSSRTFQQFAQLKQAVAPDRKLQHIDHPMLLHQLQSHLHLHVRYLMQVLANYAPSILKHLQVRIHGKPVHRIIRFKSSLSAFDLTFTTNVWLPEDLNIGHHTAYGFGVLSLQDVWSPEV